MRFCDTAHRRGAIYRAGHCKPSRAEPLRAKYRPPPVARLVLLPNLMTQRALMDVPEGVDSGLPAIEAGPTYVVGIGASAGGLEALEHFFDNVPTSTGMAFVVIQHLSPDFKSLMDEILARRTPLPISLVQDAMVVESDHIYLIPPKKEMIISGGRLLLSERDREQELTLPIDVFFRSLAQDCATRAIAVVLSGGGSDGSRGIRAVHEAG